MYEVELVRKMSMDLGEGPVWNPDDSSLYFVDILKYKLFRLNTLKDELTEFSLPSCISCFSFGTDGLIYVCLEDGLYSFNMSTEKLNFISVPEGHDGAMRFNDGKCDPMGRFYVGSMEKACVNARGSLYVIDETGGFRNIIPESFLVPNGLAWSGGVFYHVDTMEQTIYGYDWDESTGTLGAPEPAVVFDGSEGNPDGMTIDDEGMLWVCQWGGHKVGRYNPRTGEKLDEIQMPCDKPTSCVFGGPDMKDLYITTANIDNAIGELAGSLFKVRLDVGGKALNKYRTT